MDLSVVTTLYCSAPHLEEFYTRACAAVEKITDNYEIVLVNDGSPDRSLEVALELFARDPRVTIGEPEEIIMPKDIQAKAEKLNEVVKQAIRNKKSQ